MSELEGLKRKYKRKHFPRRSDAVFIAALRDFLGLDPLPLPLGQSKEAKRQQQLRARHYPTPEAQ